jgi:hypothetical protein
MVRFQKSNPAPAIARLDKDDCRVCGDLIADLLKGRL